MPPSRDERSLAGFAVSLEHADGSTSLGLRGELDRSVVDLLRWSVGRVPVGHRIELDLAAVGFVDVSGYRALRALVDDLRRRDRQLHVSDVPRCVSWLEQALGVDRGVSEGALVGAGSGSSVVAERF